MPLSVKINPLSPRTQALLRMRTIESQLPVLFEDGGFHAFTVYCARCDHPISSQHVRGLITRAGNGTYTIEAAGACFTCNIATPVRFHLQQEAAATQSVPHFTKWMPAFWRRLLRTLFPA